MENETVASDSRGDNRMVTLVVVAESAARGDIATPFAIACLEDAVALALQLQTLVTTRHGNRPYPNRLSNQTLTVAAAVPDEITPLLAERYPDVQPLRLPHYETVDETGGETRTEQWKALLHQIFALSTETSAVLLLAADAPHLPLALLTEAWGHMAVAPIGDVDAQTGVSCVLVPADSDTESACLIGVRRGFALKFSFDIGVLRQRGVSVAVLPTWYRVPIDNRDGTDAQAVRRFREDGRRGTIQAPHALFTLSNYSGVDREISVSRNLSTFPMET